MSVFGPQSTQSRAEQKLEVPWYLPLVGKVSGANVVVVVDETSLIDFFVSIKKIAVVSGCER